MRTRWISVILLSMAPLTALADGVMLNGVSARTIGRGGTNIGHWDNGVVLFDNPAAAVNVDAEELLEIGATVLFTDFDYSDPDNPGAHDGEVTPLPNFSYIRNACDSCLAYGIGVYVPAGFSEKHTLNGPAPFFPGPQLYKSFGALARILPAAAVKLSDELSVGGTLGVAISHAELEGPYFLQGAGPLQGTPMLLDLQANGAALTWSVGVQYALSCRTTIGATYQSQNRFHLDGTTRVQIPFLPPTVYDTQVDITWPQSLGAGVRHELSRRDILSCDLIWYDWSGAFDEFGIHLTNSSVPGFPNITDHFPLAWRDSLSVRVGYEHVLQNGNTLRLGYVHHRNPIPTSTLTPYIQAFLENGFSIGYGWRWGEWECDLAYMYTIGPDQTVGASGIVGGDFSLAEHEAQTHAVAVGLLRRY